MRIKIIDKSVNEIIRMKTKSLLIIMVFVFAAIADEQVPHYKVLDTVIEQPTGGVVPKNTSDANPPKTVWTRGPEIDKSLEADTMLTESFDRSETTPHIYLTVGDFECAGAADSNVVKRFREAYINELKTYRQFRLLPISDPIPTAVDRAENDLRLLLTGEIRTDLRTGDLTTCVYFKLKNLNSRRLPMKISIEDKATPSEYYRTDIPGFGMVLLEAINAQYWHNRINTNDSVKFEISSSSLDPDELYRAATGLIGNTTLADRDRDFAWKTRGPLIFQKDARCEDGLHLNTMESSNSMYRYVAKVNIEKLGSQEIPDTFYRVKAKLEKSWPRKTICKISADTSKGLKPIAYHTGELFDASLKNDTTAGENEPDVSWRTSRKKGLIVGIICAALGVMAGVVLFVWGIGLLLEMFLNFLLEG